MRFRRSDATDTTAGDTTVSDTTVSQNTASDTTSEFGSEFGSDPDRDPDRDPDAEEATSTDVHREALLNQRGMATATRAITRSVGGSVVGAVRRAGGIRLGLRHLPLLLAAITALCVVLATRSAALDRARVRREQIREQVERELEHRVDHVLAVLLSETALPEDRDMWLVDPAGKTSRSLAPTDIEPPLFNLAAAATNQPLFDAFSQRGTDFLSYTRPVSPDRSIVAITDRSYLDDEIAKQGRRALRAVLIPSILAALGVYAVARLLVRPVTRGLANRTDFLADAAHEMRTPLAVIQASAGHALSRPRSSEEYVRSLAEIRSAAERAAVGVTELLDLSRFDAGQAVPRVAPLRLDLLAEEVASAVRVDGCKVETEVGPSVVVDADMALLRQAVENVVRNASSRASMVTLRTAVDGRDGVLEVHDNGPGFTPEHLPYVFERYRRSDRVGSSGLGLAIVAAILAAHGGSAEAANGPEGGAVIRLRVPRNRSHPGV